MIRIFRKKTTKDFDEVIIGDAFKFDNQIWIKLDFQNDDEIYGAYNLIEHTIEYFGDKAQVEEVTLEIKEI